MEEILIKTAVVTGGSSGLGLGVCKTLVEDGVRVINIDRQPPLEACEMEYRNIDLVNLDAIYAFGESLGLENIKVDYLINVAGIAQRTTFDQVPREEWLKIFQVNLHAPYAMIQAVAPHIKDGGRVLVFSSGTVFNAPVGQSAYIATKMGLVGLTRALARELGGRKITVNAIYPPFTVTPGSVIWDKMADSSKFSTQAVIDAQIQRSCIKREATVSDTVVLVQFLLNDKAGFITGQAISTGGGAVLQ